MQVKDRLFMGIDISENYSMVSFLNMHEKEPQNILFSDKKTALDNPAPLSEWPDMVRSGDKNQVDMLTGYVASMIEYAKRLAKTSELARVCITVSAFCFDVLEAVEYIMSRLKFSREQWCLISHQESFAFYAYNQKKELYSAGVMLLDYGQEGLMAHLMTDGKYGSMDVIMENSYELRSESVLGVAEGKYQLSDVAHELVTWLEKPLSDHIVSSIYLTGECFNVESYPDELIRTLCRRRKVFAGQNLYVKGACFAALQDGTEGRMDNVILACSNRVTTGIELDITERGVNKRLRVIRAGTNWYTAKRRMDFIIEDMNVISVILKPCDSNREYREDIDISQIPYRRGKMTRIEIDIRFTADNRCRVTVKDKGFGEFEKSSGKIIVKDIDL